MRIGIMGGTLDPVHNGHIQLAQTVLHELKLDGVMLLPAGDPPHKTRTTSKEDRWEMVKLAASEFPGIFPCGIEINREYCHWAVKRLKNSIGDNTIQGYSDGVFWERNSLVDQKTKKSTKKSTVPENQNSLF